MIEIPTHRSYRARIAFDSEDALFVGEVAGIADGVTFHAGDYVAAYTVIGECSGADWRVADVTLRRDGEPGSV